MSVWKRNSNGYYLTRVYPDEDVTLTVTDSGDYTITIPTLPTLGDGWDYQIKQAKNGVDPRFYFSSDDSSHFATLTIYAEGNDNVPIAGDDAAAVFEDENVAILNTSTAANVSGGDNGSAVDLPGEHTGNLLLNDSDVDLDGNSLSGYTITDVKFGDGNYQSVSQELVETTIEGTYGTLNIYHDGTYNYTANKDAADPLTPGETVVDTFTYKLTDSGGFTDEATLAITVHGVGNETYDIELVIDENTDLNFQESTFPDLEGDEHNPPIVIQTLPERGTLFYQGSELTAVPQEVPHANLSQLMFRPDADTHGDDGLNNQPGYAFFTYSIDLSGDNDPVVTVNIDVTPDGNNSPPTVQTGVDTPDDDSDDTSGVGEVTTLEDTDHVFDHSEFNFYDPDDPTSDLTSITITGLPSTGKIFIDGVELTADNLATLGLDITKADIDADKVVFRPNPDENGEDYATFTFTVSDGLASSAAATMTVNVTPVNDAPTASNETVYINERHLYQGDGDRTPENIAVDGIAGRRIFAVPDFASFSDIEDGAFSNLRVTSLEADGDLEYSADGLIWTDVTENQIISYTDINNGRLRFTPDMFAENDVIFGFQLSDSDDAYSAEQSMLISVNSAPNVANYPHGAPGIDAGAINTGNVYPQISDSDDTDAVIVLTGLIAGTEFSNWENGSDLIIDGTGIGSNVAGSYGTLLLAADGSFTYTANATNNIPAGETDQDYFTYTVRDDETNAGSYAYDVGELQFYVNASNQAPTVQTGVDTPDDDTDDTSGVGEVTTLEDTDHVFDHSEFNFYDPDDPTSDLTSITITGLPSTGTIFIDEVELTADNLATLGLDITKADIDANKVIFRPNPDENGEDYATFDFTVSDGLASSAAATMTVNVTPDNDPPTIQTGVDTPDDASDDTSGVADVTTPEDTTYVFTLDDFNYVDEDNDPLDSVYLTQGPLLGQLMLHETLITTDPVYVSRAAIEAGLLKYTPPAEENGNDYTAFPFAVNDGTANSTTGTMTIHVTPHNDPPTVQTGVDTPDDDTDDTSGVGEVTTLEDTDHVFDHSEFNFYDPDDPTSDLTSITITGLPSTGTIFIDEVELTADNLATLGLDITKADIDANKVVFRPNPDENGEDYATFTFTVSDGLASSAAATMTVNVTPDNDPPTVQTGVDTPDDDTDDTSGVGEVTTLEDTDHVFDHSEFNFYDPDDPTSDLNSITITGLPSTGKIFIDGVELTADNLATLGLDITKADIDANKVVFRPNPDENGEDYATFTFTVSDGLASSAAATMTVNVTPDNDPPTVQTLGVDTPDDDLTTHQVLAR